MQKLGLALDWTPNINHIGFFVAQKKGFYKALDLKVEITSPDMDNYQITPAKRVELGQVDFALCPTESIISYRSKEKPFPLIAIAAILQSDLSAIATKVYAGIHSPKDLDHKIYSSYKARYENGIVREMIKNDGGNGNLKIIYPDTLGIGNTLMNGKADATWVFMNWEGVAADQAGIPLNYFKLKDYKIPYSYSPVLATNESLILAKIDAYQAFLKATKKGFLYCSNHPREAIDILKEELPEYDQGMDLSASLNMTIPHFGNEENWGVISTTNLKKFLTWIKKKKLEAKTFHTEEIFTDIWTAQN